MDKIGSKLTVLRVKPKQEGCVGAAQAAGSASTAVLPVQQGAWLPANRYAVVLPEMISPAPASITVCIGDHGGEAKAAEEGKSDNGKAKGRVLKIGPCGGAGGYPREMDMDGVSRIVSVVVRHCNAVDAIFVSYELDGREEETTGLWGGKGGRRSEIRLENDEYLTSVRGYYGQFDGKLVIRSLKFVSNRGNYGPYGKEEGVPFALPAAAGGKILGFHVRSGQYLDAIGTYVKMGDD